MHASYRSPGSTFRGAGDRRSPHEHVGWAVCVQAGGLFLLGGPRLLDGVGGEGHGAGSRNELLELEWSRIDRLTRQARLPVLNDKTGHGRVVPLDDQMWAIIDRRWAERTTRRWDGRVLVSRWVFHGPLGGRLHED